MAKKDDKKQADGEITIEELEAIEAEKAKKNKKKDQNPDAPTDPGPVTPPNIPDNPGTPIEHPTDHTGTVVITGDPANPEIIIIPAEEPEVPLQPAESNAERSGNEGVGDASTNINV